MSIKPELSKKSKYYIPKHRYYELKHFCLQYSFWKKLYLALESDVNVKSSFMQFMETGTTNGDPTAKQAMRMASYSRRIELIENAAKETDPDLSDYILKAVTEGLSYDHMKMNYDIPCGKDMYYDRYRRFFWILSGTRQ